MTFFKSIDELSFIDASVGPCFFSSSILKVVSPFASINHAIAHFVDAMALNAIIHEISVKDISHIIDENALSVAFFVHYFPFILASIGVVKHAKVGTKSEIINFKGTDLVFEFAFWQ